MNRRSFLARFTAGVVGACLLARLEPAKAITYEAVGTETGRYTMYFAANRCGKSETAMQQLKRNLFKKDEGFTMTFDVDLSQADAWCASVGNKPVKVNGDAARIFGDINIPSGNYIAKVVDLS